MKVGGAVGVGGRSGGVGSVCGRYMDEVLVLVSKGQ